MPPQSVRIDEFISAIRVLKISWMKFLIKINEKQKLNLFQFLVGVDVEKEIYNALINLSDDERTVEVKRLAKHYNCSISTIWRKANKAGIRARAERSDIGKTAVDEWILEHAAALINKSRRKNDKFTFDVKEIYRHMKEELGIVIDVSYSRFCELLRMRGWTVEEFKKPTPHVQVISEHPNQLHQFDVSICLQWYFDDKKGELEEDTNYKRKYYANKIEQTVEQELRGKKKLHRYVLVDHCSGAFFFWYYYALGENSIDGADFLFKAWSSKKELVSTITNSDYNGIYQFQGLPKILYTDQGAILKKKALKNLLDSLNVQLEFHESGNPRAKGMVEGLMNIIEKGFESRLKIYGIKNIDELNAYALKWCVERNLLKDFRGAKESRIEHWRKIKPEQFIKCPPHNIWAALIQEDAITRKVDGNGNISYMNKTYTVTDTNLIYKEVVVKPHAFIKDSINVHYNGLVFTLQANIKDEFNRTISANAVAVGDNKALKETATQKFDKKSEEILSNTYGVDFHGKGNKRSMRPPTKPKEETVLATDNIAYLQPAGTDAQVNPAAPITAEKRTVKQSKPAEERYIKLSELIRMYNAEHGRITVDEKEKLVALYPKGVPASVTIDDIYNMLHKPAADIMKLA